MHPEIRHFSSMKFYNNMLQDADVISRQLSPNYKKDVNDIGDNNILLPFVRPDRSDSHLTPVMFCDLVSDEERLGTTYCNRDELKFIISLLSCLSPCISACSIGIISPYKGQVDIIRKEIERIKNNDQSQIHSTTNGGYIDTRNYEYLQKLNIEINTVDAFQGREKDIIILSTVRTSRIGFVKDDRRFNVSITRAKCLLIVLGNKGVLSTSETWRQYIHFLQSRNYIYDVPFSKNFQDSMYYSILNKTLIDCDIHKTTSISDLKSDAKSM
jgi:superfamily I DNA and/or RNA helicase